MIASENKQTLKTAVRHHPFIVYTVLSLQSPGTYLQQY